MSELTSDQSRPQDSWIQSLLSWLCLAQRHLFWAPLPCAAVTLQVTGLSPAQSPHLHPRERHRIGFSPVAPAPAQCRAHSKSSSLTISQGTSLVFVSSARMAWAGKQGGRVGFCTKQGWWRWESCVTAPSLRCRSALSRTPTDASSSRMLDSCCASRPFFAPSQCANGLQAQGVVWGSVLHDASLLPAAATRSCAHILLRALKLK